MFSFFGFGSEVPSVLFIRASIGVARIMVCRRVLLISLLSSSLEHSVVFTGPPPRSAGRRHRTRSCYSHIYLFVTDFLLSDTCLVFPITIGWFPVFSNQEGLCECVVLGKGHPEPFDHLL